MASGNKRGRRAGYVAVYAMSVAPPLAALPPALSVRWIKFKEWTHILLFAHFSMTCEE